MGQRVTEQGGSSAGRRLAGVSLTFAIGFVMVGCGRPATRADCDEIFDKFRRARGGRTSLREYQPPPTINDDGDQ